jgi:transcription-repair coupling factor (superfamily II helicase)
LIKVFFIHNRGCGFTPVRWLIQKNLVPKAKIAILYGRIEGDQFRGRCLILLIGKYDVFWWPPPLLKLFGPKCKHHVIHAPVLGLSDLHQMRGGRVRYNKAFVIYWSPPLSTLTPSEAFGYIGGAAI